MHTQKSILTQRAQMFAAAFGFWVFLAFWSISAFWQHVDSLKPEYLWAARIGACSAEFAILVMVFLKCFNKHINVRKLSLILGTALIVAVVIHTAGLRGLDEARTERAEAEKRLAEQLTKMSEAQMRSTRRKADVAKSAQKELAEANREGNEKIKESSIFPRWYLDGWMYGVLFALSAIALAIPLGMMGNRLDVDADFDGVADHKQEAQGRERLAQLEAITAQRSADFRPGEPPPTKAMTGEFPDALPTGKLEEEPGKARRR